MYYVEFTLLLRALLVVLVALGVYQLARYSGWRGRLMMIGVALVCAATKPGREEHLAALGRALPEVDAARLDARVESHDFLVVSASTVDGRLVSIGWLARIFACAAPCRSLSAAPAVRHTCE